MFRLNLTESEREAIIKELAERMKDIVYINAEKRAEEVIEQLLAMNLKPDSNITISYVIHFTFDDILQMLGRLRRKSGGE
ncbi:MAG: hypothetical protein NDF55_10885 [archaeon GB-1867-005]|nr:hypothetical protein [Candidatus Culexmicrobium cathedralense]